MVNNVLTNRNAGKRIGDFFREMNVDNPFCEGLAETFGFGLGYDRVKHEECFQDLKLHAVSNRGSKQITEQVWRNSTECLEIRVEYELFPEHNALKYQGRIHNIGDKPIPRVKDLHTVQWGFPVSTIGPPTIHGAGGGMKDNFYPPPSYRRFDTTLVESRYGDGLIVGSRLGRSSNAYLPFFVVSNGADSHGIFFALGWSGNWKAKFQLHETNQNSQQFLIKAWLPAVDLMLMSGEEIPIPEVLIGLYDGSALNGMNALRRTIYERYVPLLAGKKVVPLTGFGSWFAYNGIVGAPRINEHSLKKQVDTAAEIGCEYFEVDDGWEVGWQEGLGFNERRMDWVADEAKFPFGLDKFAKYVEDKGMKFGLWLDLARTTRRSNLLQEHPEWVIWSEKDPDRGLVNFGLSQVREWAKGIFSELVEKYHMQWVRNDYNVDPEFQWTKYDPPERKGITEIRHIEGLYEVMEWVLKNYPSLCVEQCASGGRMIDLGTLRRAHMVFVSDHTISADICRYHLSGASCFLPSILLHTDLSHHTEAYPDVFYLSRFGGALGIGDDIARWSPVLQEKAKKMIGIYKLIRHFLAGDFYPVFSQPVSIREWDGWQFHDPSSDSGIVVVFRVQSTQAQKLVKLSALDRHKSYSLTNLLISQETVVSGQTLQDEGFAISLECGEAEIWRYQPSTG